MVLYNFGNKRDVLNLKKTTTKNPKHGLTLNDIKCTSENEIPNTLAMIMLGLGNLRVYISTK